MVKKDKFIQDPKHPPVSVAMTQFHITFIFEHNITVFSNTSKKIVHSEQLDSYKIKQGHFDLFGEKLVLLSSMRNHTSGRTMNQFLITDLLNEEGNLGKEYLEVGDIKQSLQHSNSQ